MLFWVGSTRADSIAASCYTSLLWSQGLEGLSGFELEAAERKIKLRTVGTIRLIAELYKKSVVKEPVVHACIQELLGQAAGPTPSEDNVEVNPRSLLSG